jgi:hypothetical protein
MGKEKSKNRRRSFVIIIKDLLGIAIQKQIKMLRLHEELRRVATGRINKIEGVVFSGGKNLKA